MTPNEYTEIESVRDLRKAVDNVQPLMMKKDIAFLRRLQTSLRGIPFVGTWAIYDLDREAFGYNLMLDIELADTCIHSERWCFNLCSFRKTITIFRSEEEVGWAEFEDWIKTVRSG